ncbi:histidine kinase [Pseudomonas sp. F1_0610]|uniref:sensor histidine kinase n=1 Tax=Pseudomonas sp. F1_0610 TaxID=3114284 RepID=UPI0039C16B61
MNKYENQINTQDDFFVPELCENKALLSLILVAQLIVIVLILAENNLITFNWERFALVSFFVQWNVLLSAALICTMRPLLKKLTIFVSSISCLTLIVGITLVCTYVAAHLPMTNYENTIEIQQVYIKHGLISLIISAILLRHFYLQSQWKKEKQAELKARLAALRARIDPHFLFNSLNSIASLIATNPDSAEKAVLDLSDLFRASLSDQNNNLTTWSKEIRLAKHYIDIEKLRFAERLNVTWDCSNIPDNLPIAPLTLQPLLENAIVHGIQASPSGGLIHIQASCQQGFFELMISNPMPQQAVVTSKRGTQIAIKNIQARFTALFGENATLSASQQHDRYITRLRYPCAKPSLEAKQTP